MATRWPSTRPKRWGQRVFDRLQLLEEVGASDPPVTYSTNTVYAARPYGQRYDAGVTGSVGFVAGRVQVQALYCWGVTNSVRPRFRSGVNAPHLYHWVGQLTLTCFLGERQ